MFNLLQKVIKLVKLIFTATEDYPHFVKQLEIDFKNFHEHVASCSHVFCHIQATSIKFTNYHAVCDTKPHTKSQQINFLCITSVRCTQCSNVK